ncbi:MAG: hypothetical protein Q9205_002157 [Flavoplaca limonia]
MVRNNLSKLLNRLSEEGKVDQLPGVGSFNPTDPDHLPPRPDDSSHDLPPDTKIGIIGAGYAGLYSALILDHLGVAYDILEASPRPGGRVLTHYFSTRKHDYYDIGAMRFPNVPPMERTFDLFKRTGVPLIDYLLKGENTPKRYNGITVFPPKDGATVEEDPFNVSVSKGGLVPDERMKTIGQVLEEAFAPLKDALKRGDAESFKLFEELDKYTVRGYLHEKMNLDFETIEWLEETDSATGLFDLAFTEAVIDVIAFDYGPEEEEWKSVEGGTNVMTEALVDMLKTKPTYNKRVTRVALDRNRKGENKMVVVTNYDEPPRYYTVYPSYNINDDPEKPAVLLCTYTWAQDATRIGSLVNTDSPRGEDELKGLMLYNLARLHSNESNFEEMYEMIKASYITHYGFDWAMDDYSSGAYAFFGPGQFSALYPSLIRPQSDSRFHIVGEAASANHAWIVGALESAYRGVWMVLERFKCYDLQGKMEKEFGGIPELETGKEGVAHLLCALGMLSPKVLARGEKAYNDLAARGKGEVAKA